MSSTTEGQSSKHASTSTCLTTRPEKEGESSKRNDNLNPHERVNGIQSKPRKSITKKKKNLKLEEEWKKQETFKERRIQSEKRQTMRYILRRWKIKAEESRKLKQDKDLGLESIAFHARERPFDLFPNSYFKKRNTSSMNSPFLYSSPYMHRHSKLEELRVERLRRKEAMFSPIDIPSLISQTMHKKNPLLPCVCWKITVYSRLFDSSDDLQQVPISLRTKIGEWLRVKLSNSDKKNQLSPDIVKIKEYENTDDDFPNYNTVQNNIYKNACTGENEIENNRNSSNSRRKRTFFDEKETQKLLWFIVKDTKFDQQGSVVEKQDAMDSCAIIFVAMGGVSMEEERKRLLSIIQCIPDSKSAPLLILAFKPKLPAEIDIDITFAIIIVIYDFISISITIAIAFIHTVTIRFLPFIFITVAIQTSSFLPRVHE